MTIRARRCRPSASLTRSFRRRMTKRSQSARRRDRPLLGVAGVWLVVAGLVSAGCTTGEAPTAPGATSGQRTLRIDLQNFRFDPAVVDVRLGQEITFVAVNPTDLPHELFIASPAGQEAHHALHASATSGSEGELDVGATGVYVPARGTAQFTYRFEAAGELQMGCHLVGHWEAGMVGLVRVGAE